MSELKHPRFLVWWRDWMWWQPWQPCRCCGDFYFSWWRDASACSPLCRIGVVAFAKWPAALDRIATLESAVAGARFAADADSRRMAAIAGELAASESRRIELERENSDLRQRFEYELQMAISEAKDGNL